MKKILIVGVSSMLLCFITSSFALPIVRPRIGVVNTRKILLNSKRFAKIQKNMKAEIASEEAKLKKAQDAIQAEYIGLNSTSMSKKAKVALQKKVAKDKAHLLKLGKKYASFTLSLKQKYLEPMAKELKLDVRTIAREKNLNLVLSSRSVLYRVDNFDITKEVAKKFG